MGMGGIVDFYAILTGGAWILKEGLCDICEGVDDQNRTAQIQQFVANHTDSQLEEFLREELRNPDSHNAIWEALERFKREHPVWCDRHAERGWYGQYTQKYYEPNFGWQDIGSRRAPLLWNGDTWRAAQNKWGNGKMPKWFVNQEIQKIEGNRARVLQMLMEIHGKMCVLEAHRNATKEYPLKKSKRSW